MMRFVFFFCLFLVFGLPIVIADVSFSSPSYHSGENVYAIVSFSSPLYQPFVSKHLRLLQDGNEVKVPFTFIYKDSSTYFVWFQPPQSGSYTFIVDVLLLGTTVEKYSSSASFMVLNSSTFRVTPPLQYVSDDSSLLRFTVTNLHDTVQQFHVSSVGSFLSFQPLDFSLVSGNSKDVFVSIISSPGFHEGSFVVNNQTFPVFVSVPGTVLLVNDSLTNFTQPVAEVSSLQFVGKQSFSLSLSSTENVTEMLTLVNDGDVSVHDIRVSLTGGFEDVISVSPVSVDSLSPGEGVTFTLVINANHDFTFSRSGSLLVTSSADAVVFPLTFLYRDDSVSVSEICDNNFDDDSNGFVDCADPVCTFAVACVVSEENMSASTSISTVPEEQEESSFGLYLVLGILILLFLVILFFLYVKGKKQSQRFDTFVSALQKRQ